MNLQQEALQGYTLLSILDERIDAHNSAELKDYLLGLLEKGNTQIIVNLGKVRFIDSSGLGALLSGQKNSLAKSGKLVLTNIQTQVYSMFELTRLNRVFEIFADVDAVLKSGS